MSKGLLFVLLFAIVWKINGYNFTTKGVKSYDIHQLSIFYDLRTNHTIGTRLDATNLRLPVLGTPCSCEGLTCGCCAGINIQQFNFNQKACTNLTYDPYDFSIRVNIMMNENVIYQNSISAKNPPPLCVPVPVPYVPISLDFCIKLFDIYTPGSNLHGCLDIEARIQQASVFVLHFDCIRMGADGVTLLKPEDNGGLVGGELQPQLPDPEIPQENGDVYDEVTEIKENNAIKILKMV